VLDVDKYRSRLGERECSRWWWMCRDSLGQNTHNRWGNGVHVVNFTFLVHCIGSTCRDSSTPTAITTEVANAIPVTLGACLVGFSKALSIGAVNLFVQMFYRLRCWTKWCLECGARNIESVLASLDPRKECFCISKFICWRVELCMVAAGAL
jgi:hypothetical protein